MKFGPVPVREAIGTVLAHSAKVESGRLRKGRVLDADDVAALETSGIATVEVARLEDGDVAEDEAAARVAHAIAGGNGLIVADPATGRANVFAAHAGLFVVERKFIDEVNAMHPALTVATLASDELVGEGRMVATVKIIAFAIPDTVLQAVDDHVRRAFEENPSADAHPMEVAAPVPLAVGLVATELDVVKETTMDKTAQVLADRLTTVGSSLACEERVPHDVAAVAKALGALAERCDAVVVFGASAVVDDADVIPSAITVQQGGQVEFVGMPVDPGNLLVYGTVGTVPVIGAPGCARSPAENGFDWVLRRVCHRVPVGRRWSQTLGVGGLLMEIGERPQPRKSTT